MVMGKYCVRCGIWRTSKPLVDTSSPVLAGFLKLRDLEDVVNEESDENSESDEPRSDPNTTTALLPDNEMAARDSWRDAALCSPDGDCSQKRRRHCRLALADYCKRTGQDEETEGFQISRHIFLIALLSATLVVHMFDLFWQALHESVQSASCAPLHILDTFLVMSQGFYVFLLWGVDVESLGAAVRRWRGVTRKLTLPTSTELDETSKAVCRSFATNHLTKARTLLPADIRQGMRIRSSTFRGSSLVDWLIQEGLCTDRTSAVKYGRRLVLGRMVEHINQEQHFYDSFHLLYRFSRENALGD